MQNLIPKSLDEIIRSNRDKYSLSLSRIDELKDLPPIVIAMTQSRQINATINNWRFVCFKTNTGDLHFLTGIHTDQKCVWATSIIVAIDLEHGFALTKSGNIYKLGTKGDGEPEVEILLHICAQFHRWGIGNMLGVTHVFY